MSMELVFKIVTILLLLGDATLDLMWIQKQSEEEKGNTIRAIGNVVTSVILMVLTGWLGAGVVAMYLLMILIYRKYVGYFGEKKYRDGN